jgi:hypothetical protein
MCCCNMWSVVFPTDSDRTPRIHRPPKRTYAQQRADCPIKINCKHLHNQILFHITYFIKKTYYSTFSLITFKKKMCTIKVHS